MSRVYPCGVMIVGERLESNPTDSSAAWKIHPSGRTVSRMLRAGYFGTISFTFSETWRVSTICCVGPCLMVRATIGSILIYPYPTGPSQDGTLFVLADRILERSHPMTIEVQCLPQLFMLDGDEEAKERPKYFDEQGLVWREKPEL